MFQLMCTTQQPGLGTMLLLSPLPASIVLPSLSLCHGVGMLNTGR